MKTDGNKNACNTDSNQIKNLKKMMNDFQDYDKLDLKSNYFKALSDPTRLKIIYLLKNGELYV